MSTNGETNGHLAEETAELESQINGVLSNTKMILCEIDEEKEVLEKHRKKIKCLHEIEEDRMQTSATQKSEGKNWSIGENDYQLGVRDAVTGIMPTSITARSGRFIIFIDDKDYVHLTIAKSFYEHMTEAEALEFKDKLNDIYLHIGNIASAVRRVSEGKDRTEYLQRLTRSLAGYIAFNEDDTILLELSEMERLLEKRVMERFRTGVFKNISWWVAGSIVLIISVTWSGLLWDIMNPGWVSVIYLIPFGMLGACISIVIKQRTVFPDPSIWLPLLWKEITAKILLGGATSSILALFLKTGFLVSLPQDTETSEYVSVMIIFALIAGSSERMLGSLLSKAEDVVEIGAKPSSGKPVSVRIK